MAKTPKPIPDGYTAVTPYLTVKGAAAAIDFYRKAFNAEQSLRLDTPEGKVLHAELRIGGAAVMLHDEMPQWKAMGLQTIGDSGSSVMLYVHDVDAVFKRAVEAGAKATMAPCDQFYGDRCGSLVDPFGHKWTIATHVEDVAPDDLKLRAEMWFEKAGS